MNIDNKEHAIVIGDYSNNTLGVIRSLGKAKAPFFLLLILQRAKKLELQI